LALPLFAVTLFVSAFLLFLVQPMIGKLILPKLGGTPQVWNTCMMFFQMALLAGYGYTHTVSTRLPLRKQLVIHGILLLLPLAVLLPTPFNITSWIPPTEANPIPAALLLLTIVVGLPFFVVSTSAPLLQKWFSTTDHPAAKDPYFLYGASNLGSLLSLIAYPFLIEPYFSLLTQPWIWTAGYVVLAVLVAASAALVWNVAPPAPVLTDMPNPEAVPAPMPEMAAETAIQPATALRGVRKKGAKLATQPAVETKTAVDISKPRDEAVTGWRRLRWILLAAAPSSLMLGVTSYVSTDLSPFPLLWVIPLALYLLSFILVFSKWPTVWIGTPHSVMLFIQPIAMLALCLIIMRGGFTPTGPTIFSFLGFFIAACVCHGELAKDRPTPRHLTEFFLLMSVGGMLGGVFNGLFAPVIFFGVAEYPIAIVLVCLLRPLLQQNGWIDDLILRTAPDFERNTTQTSDNTAQALGMKPDHTPWLFNVAMDVLLGLFVFAVAWFLRSNAAAWRWHPDYQPQYNNMVKILKFLGFSTEAAWEWRQAGYNAFVYGPPMLMAFFMAIRPLRFGLAVAGILLANTYMQDSGRDTLCADRSYFGVLRVFSRTEDTRGHVESEYVEAGRDGSRSAAYTSLLHGTTHHGQNYFNPIKLDRLATTYYHRWGPVGVVMERYNWLPGPQNTFWADFRMPTALAGLGATPLGVGALPVDALTQVWSEPPCATIGLGTGTMASYGRPLQHVVYYEIDEKIRNFSLPPDDSLTMALDGKREPYFRYLKGALQRGVNLEVIMGDARLSMENSQKRDVPRPGSLFHLKDEKIVHDQEAHLHPRRDKYYKVIVVDAFSSDAIPVHLITREAIELYMDQLQDDGVLCVHTSNRHLELVKPVADIANELGIYAVVGHDPGTEQGRAGRGAHGSLGHTGSEYVMLSRSKKRLDPKQLEKILLDPRQPHHPSTNPVVSISLEKFYGPQRQWYVPEVPRMRIWTDDFSNIISILRH